MEDLIGMQFSELKVLGRAGYRARPSGKVMYWNCECSVCKRVRKLERPALILRKGQPIACRCNKGGAVNGIYSKHGEAAFVQIYNDYKHRAKKYNRKFTRTKAQFKKLCERPCHYCGQLPLQSAGKVFQNDRGDWLHNGIDRIDSSKGYVKNNMVPCCWGCNQAKSNRKLEEFLAWAKRFVAFRK